jgi:hypothetical protein
LWIHHFSFWFLKVDILQKFGYKTLCWIVTSAVGSFMFVLLQQWNFPFPDRTFTG